MHVSIGYVSRRKWGPRCSVRKGARPALEVRAPELEPGKLHAPL
jgi:hypothetical protein